MPAEQPEHGTPKRYRGGCRCQRCRDGWAAYHRDQRAAARAPRAARSPARGGRAVGEGGQLAAEGRRLAALWAAEAPAKDADALEPGDTGEQCAEGHPMRWTGAHTLLVCLPCRSRRVPPAARHAEAAHEQARTRRAERGSAEVAVPRDSRQARAARRQLEGARRMVADYQRQLSEQLEAAGELAGLARRAYMLRLEVDTFQPEISRAESVAELNEIHAELRAIADGGECRELLGALERAEWAEQQAEYLEQQAEYDEQQAEYDEPAELAAPAERLALERGPAPPDLEQLAERLRQQHARKMAALGERGMCELGWHLGRVPATRRYGARATYAAAARMPAALAGRGGPADFMRPALDESLRTIRVCPAHYAKAEQVLEREFGGAPLVYADLGGQR